MSLRAIRPATLAEVAPPSAAEDFTELVQQARQDWLPKWCEGLWSDFNDHDPGVMILEQLVYALTSVAYRAGRDIPTLLRDARGEIPWEENCLYPPERILTTHPLTAADYARLIYDRFPEVVYASVGPVMRKDDPFAAVPGRLMAEIAVNSDAPQRVPPEYGEPTLAGLVHRLLNQHRNLGERFEDVRLIAPVYLEVRMKLEFKPGVDVAAAVARLHLAARQALQPGPRFQTMADALSAMPMDEALSGPLLSRGVIADADLPRLLTAAEARDDVRKAICSSPDLQLVSELQVSLGGEPPNGRAFFAPGEFVLMARVAGSNVSGRTADISFLHPDEQQTPTRAFAAEHREVRRTSRRDGEGGAERPGEAREQNVAPPEPVAPWAHLVADPGAYYSIQEQFPSCFGLAAGALGSDVAPLRLAQVRQLKGYLLPFEQLLANYCRQLAHTRDVFSHRPQRHTLFVQPLDMVPEVLPLLWREAGSAPDEAQRAADFWTGPGSTHVRELAAIVESPAEFVQRRHRILDHLLARFNESFPRREETNYETIANKEALLREYVALSANRSATSDLPAAGAQEGAETSRRKSPLEQRITALLRRDVVAARDTPDSAAPEEPDFYYLLESLRLLPSASPVEPVAGPALTVSIDDFDASLVHVFINWTDHPFTASFKDHVSRIVLEHAPAHLHHRFVWLEVHASEDESESARIARLEAPSALRVAWREWQADPENGLPLIVAAPIVSGARTFTVRADTPAARLFAWLKRHAPDPVETPPVSS